MRSLAPLLVSLVLTFPLHAAATDVSDQLRALRLTDDRATLTAAGRALLTRLKRELRDEAQRALERKQVASREYANDEIGGFVVEAHEVAGGYVAVQTSIGIPCGSDTSLYLFRGARLIAAAEGRPLRAIADGQQLLQFALAPPYLAVGTVNAACVSNWQTLRVRVLDLDRGTTLLDRTESIFDPYDNGFDLTLDGSTVTASFVGGPDEDAMPVRKHVRYVIPTSLLSPRMKR